ncbi:leucine-rich repeat/extensin 1 [Actinidia rufa]|uniref:Cell wall hydroxyproline-rich glycoprotein n=1 Tax=Actinidia rufa TaxID=165716 RepID=A0A7J0HF92_9ERIC|nr:leucine-rich repeat/extensin 1 [Actinidia rufa]
MPQPFCRGRKLFAIFVLSFFAFQICSADNDKDDSSNDVNKLQFENARLRKAYIALQSWKSAIFSDPFNFTADWTGPDVCSYAGVFCAPSPSDPTMRVVAGIDLNHADIAGYLPPELGLLTDLALFHINSNRFCGSVPLTFLRMKLLHELDLSNNRFVGKFPGVVLGLPSLKYLDLRFNEFEGPVPSKLFDKDLDAIFLNDNRFRFGIPENLGSSPVSVLVFANNNLGGCIPGSIGKMGKTLNEIILMNDNLTGCLPASEIGHLKKLTVFDVSFNNLQGSLPSTIGWMKSLEQLDVAHNRFTGIIPSTVCKLPNLKNFTYSFNYFIVEIVLQEPTRVMVETTALPGRRIPPPSPSTKDPSSSATHRAEVFTTTSYLALSPPTYSSPPPSYHHSSPPPPTEKMSPKTHHAPPPPTIANTPPPPQIYYHVPPVPKTSLPPPPPPVGHYVPPPPYEQNTAPPPIEVPSPDYKSYASPPPPLPPPHPTKLLPPSVAPSPEAGCVLCQDHHRLHPASQHHQMIIPRPHSSQPPLFETTLPPGNGVSYDLSPPTIPIIDFIFCNAIHVLDKEIILKGCFKFKSAV